MARIFETKGLTMDLDNPTKAQKAKLKKLKPEMYEKLFKKASTKYGSESLHLGVCRVILAHLTLKHKI